VWQLALSSHCRDESLSSGECSVGAVRDEDDLDLWSCLKNVSEDESGKVFESSKVSSASSSVSKVWVACMSISPP
jgi:hypothetical protein